MFETVLFNDMIPAFRDCNKAKYVTHHFTSEFCIKYISCKKIISQISELCQSANYLHDVKFLFRGNTNFIYKICCYM